MSKEVDMHRRLVVASALAIVVTAAFLPGSGLGSSLAAARGAQIGIPAGLADAIHARLGAGAIRSSLASLVLAKPPLLGYSVAVSADQTTALVGAPGVNKAKGAAYIFHVSGAGSWSSRRTPTATLTNKTGLAQDMFGNAVALSADGTTAAVVADLGGTGAIYVFHVAAEDAWASSSTPTATLTGVEAFSGLALSPDGTTLVVGAPFYNTGYGRAAVFHVASEGAWVTSSTPTAILSNALESGSDKVGLAVAISGDGTTVLVSDSFNSNGGGAYLYHVADEGSWATTGTPTAILSDASLSNGDHLGAGVALSGDGTVALLGAPGADSVDVFRASGEAAWATTSTPTATLSNPEGSGDFFGAGVALSTDGTTALVSAPKADETSGCAFVFRVAGEGSWVSSSEATAVLHNSGARPKDVLGTSSALASDGKTVLLGAPGVRFLTGAADVFHVSAASSWASTFTPTAVLTDSALNRCVVPKLKGRTVPAARVALRVRSCRLGRVTRVRSNARKGRVVSQSRKPGSRPAVGTRVAVKIAE
jgi:hypothetical protein